MGSFRNCYFHSLAVMLSVDYFVMSMIEEDAHWDPSCREHAICQFSRHLSN